MSASIDFKAFFQKATGGREPYPYQERFATGEKFPLLLNAPTGAGKTATAILGWLWRLRNHDHTPRRLVYCLPMRVLVEQTETEAREWIAALQLNIPVHVLMGGVEAEKWFLDPHQPAVLIGTQDMLLSRALNRGYAASRFHWPIDFGLLNNDCLWVFDEPQLMANGVSTSAQLAGLRVTFPASGSCPSLWMSATLEPGWLNTIDFRGKFDTEPMELDDHDYDPKRPLNERMTAAKILDRLEAASSKDMKDLAKAAWGKHEKGTQTLVIANTVDRAKAIYGELSKLCKKAESPKLLLVHSRFRPKERSELNELLKEQGDETKDRIIVATQVVEAGVDISARTLITELCPWASMVQRIGRCNRAGVDGTSSNPARVWWIDLDEKQAPPYEPADLAFSREQLAKLDQADVSPKALNDFKRINGIELPLEHKHVLRRRDLLDLFDTAPDLSGNDIDISRFVRSDDPDTDVQIFWRKWLGELPNESKPKREELCSAPVGQVKNFLKLLADKKRGAAYIWDHLDDQWVKLDVRQVRPGLVILLHVRSGGYSEERGWDLASDAEVIPHPPTRPEREEAVQSDQLSLTAQLTIEQHTNNVCSMLETLLHELDVAEHAEALRQAARWHDAGKAHSIFQDALRRISPELPATELWAKSGGSGKLKFQRPYFRHELTSALAALRQSVSFDVAYLVASHHGKVRLSIRSLAGETPPDDPQTLFALGNFDGDDLPAVNLGQGVSSTETRLELSPMRLGGDASWTGRALELLLKVGPFKLAYLEAILRVADVRASREESDRE